MTSSRKLYEDIEFVHATIKMVRTLIDHTEKFVGVGVPMSSMWHVGADDQRIVDMSGGTWVHVESDTSARDVNNPVADWISLWNPFIIKHVLAMMASHCLGVGELVHAHPELEGTLQVSKEVLELAQLLQRYVLADCQVDEEGMVVVDARRLRDIK